MSIKSVFGLTDEEKTADVWRELWPACSVLVEYISSNANLFHGKYVLELGAGYSALPSVMAARCGAAGVVVTDKACSATLEIQTLQRENLKSNLSQEQFNRCSIDALDWRDPDSCERLATKLHTLDIVIGSDIFFDPCVFTPLMTTIKNLLDQFPQAQFIFSYENRCSDWSIIPHLRNAGLICDYLYSTELEETEITLGRIRVAAECELENRMRYFAGIEGGATQFRYVIVNEQGEKVAAGAGDGLNLLLEGVQGASKKIASTLRKAAEEHGIPLPLNAIGLGLAGAEDDAVNERMVDYFQNTYADISVNVHLTTDAVIAIAATFKKGGIVFIAGTGSSCRLLKIDGSVFGCGGWGHLIGDGGSGYWIASKAVQTIFDIEDGLETSSHSLERLLDIVTKHFGVANKLALLDVLYGNTFSKARLASLCESLAKEGVDDPLVQDIFYSAGHIMGRHLVAVSKHFDAEMFEEVPFLMIGSVWKSWSLIKNGFQDALKAEKRIRRVSFYELKESPCIGAAVLAAKLLAGYNNFTKLDAERSEKSVLKDQILND